MGACEEVVYLPNCHVGRDHWMMITFLSFGCCFSVKKNLQTKAIYHCYTMAARSICCRMMLPSTSWNLSIAGNTPRPPRTQSEISGTTWNHPIFWKKKHRFHRDFPNEWTTQWIKTRFFRVPFLENPGQHRASSNLWPQSRSLAGEKKLAIHHSSIIHQSSHTRWGKSGNVQGLHVWVPKGINHRKEPQRPSPQLGSTLYWLLPWMIVLFTRKRSLENHHF